MHTCKICQVVTDAARKKWQENEMGMVSREDLFNKVIYQWGIL